MAPSLACALWTLMAIIHDGDSPGRTSPAVFRFDNQANAAYLASQGQTEQNHIATVTFDWTNPGFSKLITRFTPSTNLTN